VEGVAEPKQLTLQRSKDRSQEWALCIFVRNGVGQARGAHDFAKGMSMLRRRAAAAFRSTKPSGKMEARSLRRTVPVIRFHRRIRRRSIVAERGCLGLRTEGLRKMYCATFWVRELVLTVVARHGGGWA